MFVQKPSNSKITEKLKILTKRLNSVLIQVYHLKNILLSDDGNFNQICSDSTYEPALKLLLRKFPNIDIKTNKSTLEILTSIHQKIIDDLYFHYYTLVDVLDIKDNIMDLFGQISAFQFSLDINTNFDMTRCYLEIIANYSTVMIILSNIPQIKSILVLYNFATFSKFDQDERFYHRLCERLVEKHKDGTGLMELYTELNPYSKTIINAVSSLAGVVKSKQLPIAGWDANKQFSLSDQSPNGNSDRLKRASLLPYSELERWVILGYVAVYPEILKSQAVSQLLRTVLTFSYNMVLFRNELLQIHPFLVRFFDSQKGFSKLTTMVRESARELSGGGIGLHHSRRKHLRLVMRHQLQQIIDRPAIMGPHIGALCHTIANATDELHWLTRHSELLPSKKFGTIKPDDLADVQLPEFMHQIEEIRFLLQEFGVVEDYYGRVLSVVDLPALREMLPPLANLLEPEESEILDELVDKLENGDNAENGPDNRVKPYKDWRLDWCRLQACWSYSGARFLWKDNTRFVDLLNSITVHSHLVDNLSHFLDKFSSQRYLYFHRTKLNEWFDTNLKLAAQHRYAVVFARLCGQFLSNCNREYCPSDYNAVLRVSTEMAHTFLGRVCQEVCKLMASMVKAHFELDLAVQPHRAVDLFQQQQLQRRQTEIASGTGTVGRAGKATGTGGLQPISMPGLESKRTDITRATNYDLELLALNQLAAGLNSRPMVVNGRTFQPNGYLRKELLKFLNEKFVTLSNIQIKRDKGDAVLGIRRPSEMLLIIKECMSLVSKATEFVHINTAQLFTEVFLRQSLNKDMMGHSTLTELYSSWYVDYILAQPHILHTPLLKCFLTIVPQNPKEAANIVVNVEEYTDIEELRSLVEVIGPYGMIELNEKIMQMIIKHVGALRRFVLRNRATLTELNVINLDYNKIKKLLLNIEDVDEFCQQWKQMGILFAFKDLCRDAVREVVRRAMPFLKATVEDLQHDFDTDLSDHMSSVSEHDAPTYGQFKNQLVISQLCNGFGLKTKVDSTLFNAIESIKLQQQQLQSSVTTSLDQTEDNINELLMVATSYLLPRLVGSNFYHVEYESLEQSAHCTAYAIKELMYVFFFRYGEERLDGIVRTFIALTSSNLLRLGIETSSSAQTNKDEAGLIGNRDSIYIFFDFVIQTLENVSDDFYEECFPYALVRQAYHNVVKQSRLVMTKAAHPTEASSKAAIEAYKINK